MKKILISRGPLDTSLAAISPLHEPLASLKTGELCPGLCHLTLCPIGCLKSGGRGWLRVRVCRERKHTFIPGLLFLYRPVTISNVETVFLPLRAAVS